jgi:hypothetical protein
MAIAPLPQVEGLERLHEEHGHWPKPNLRIVTDPRDAQVHLIEDEPRSWATGRDVTERRQRRAQLQRRRRRVVVGIALCVVVVMLALPLRALGTVTVSGQQTPGGTPAGLLDGSVYVVQPGDTLASIAERINPDANQGALVSVMARELGSRVIVPGEHVVLP